MENKRLFGKMCYLHRQLCRENSQLFAEYGISPVQMQALVYISIQTAKGERVCQKDVEKQINLRPSSVSTLLTNLEKQNFLVRTVSEGDARTKYLELTAKGKDICFKDKLLMDSCDKEIQSALTEQEQEEFLRLIQKIIYSITTNAENN